MDRSIKVPILLCDLLIASLAKRSERPALVLEDGAVLTAAEVAAEVSRYQQVFAISGLQAGARVGILSANRVEVLHVTCACMLSALVIVPLPPTGALEDQAFMARDAGLEALVFDPAAFDQRIAGIVDRCEGLATLLSLGPSELNPSARNLCAEAAVLQAHPLEAPALRGDELIRLAYSGGTTGRPKAIMLDHQTMTTCLDIQLAEWDWPEEVRQLVCAPLSHSGAATFLPTLIKGGLLVLMSRFDPLAVMQAIERHRITCILMVPTMIYAVLDHPRFGEFDLSSLEVLYYGASPISPSRLREGINKLGPVFFQFFGQSEAPMTVTVLRRCDHDPKIPGRLASCGRPVRQVKFALLDDHGDPVAAGTPGEICVRGPLVMSGYWNQPEQTAAAFANGWLHTGDIGIEDGDGFVSIVDRKKDMIITGGFNVYPREVEDVLSEHPAVHATAVIGVPHPKWGEMVIAVVVPHPGVSCPADELIALIRSRKGAVQAPKIVEFVDAIPLTAMGKPDKKALRVAYREKGFEHT